MWTRTLGQVARGLGWTEGSEVSATALATASATSAALPIPTTGEARDPIAWRTPGEVFCGWYQSSHELLSGLEVFEDVWLDGGDLGPLADALSFA